MPRRSRVVIPGEAHHVTQRGNNRQNIFLEEEDFENYCYWINEYASKYNIDIRAYCLMKNHVHLVVVPKDTEGMALFFRTVHMRYAQYFNWKRKGVGHIWQSRYFSCPMDNEHSFWAIRYVEQNPVRAGMVESAWDYTWSSAKWHVGENNSKYIYVKDANIVDKDKWREYIEYKDLFSDDLVRKNTKKGLIIGDGALFLKSE